MQDVATTMLTDFAACLAETMSIGSAETPDAQAESLTGDDAPAAETSSDRPTQPAQRLDLTAAVGNAVAKRAAGATAVTVAAVAVATLLWRRLRRRS